MGEKARTLVLDQMWSHQCMELDWEEGLLQKKKKTVTGLGIKSRGTIMKDRKNSGRYYLSPRPVWPWWCLAERVCGNGKK